MSKDERRAFWKQHIEAYRSSGLSVVEYCVRENIKPSTFRDRRKELDEAYGTNRIVKLDLMVQNAPHPHNTGFELLISKTLTLRIPNEFDTAALVRLLESLGVRQ